MWHLYCEIGWRRPVQAQSYVVEGPRVRLDYVRHRLRMFAFEGVSFEVSKNPVRSDETLALGSDEVRVSK
jgi:hypothetical protein